MRSSTARSIGRFGDYDSAPTPGQGFYRARSVSGPADTNLVFIQPGTFTMGSPTIEAERDPGETQHAVTISRGFWMGKSLVTQGDYLAVVGSNPSFFRNGIDGTNNGGRGTIITNELLHPVETVSWADACWNRVRTGMRFIPMGVSSTRKDLLRARSA